jgi:dihydroxy-acid dehydratase
LGKSIARGIDKAPQRALLKGLGLGDGEILKPVVGVITAFSGLVPGHNHLKAVADAVREGVFIGGGTPVILPCVFAGAAAGAADSDFALAARELVADNVEMLTSSNPLDAAVLIGGSDITTVGMIMGAARTNIPILVCGGGPASGGTPANPASKSTATGMSALYETLGRVNAGKASSYALAELESSACPRSGGDSSPYMSGTFSCLSEALGLSLFGNGTIAANSSERLRFSRACGVHILEVLEKQLIPKKILTADALKNAATVNIALNAGADNLLHLIAIANEANIAFSLNDVDAICLKTPTLCSFVPQGEGCLSDLDDAGGIPAVLSELYKLKLISQKPLTVSGQTVGESIVEKEIKNQRIIRPLTNPYAQNGLMTVLRGNLAEDGCIAKHPVGSGGAFSGNARIFDSCEDAAAAVKSRLIKTGDCMVIRYIGPKGAPGMRDVLLPFANLYGAELSDSVAVITDGRINGGARGLAVGHITPEASEGGVIALIEENDKIEIDLSKGKINLSVGAKDIANRRKKWRPRDITPTGYLLRYRALVTDASKGATLKTKF